MTKKKNTKRINTYKHNTLTDKIALRYLIRNNPKLNESKCITDMYVLSTHYT